MFDIGASELLMIVVVAVVVIGPKDMPLAMRTAGRWIGKMRKISNHFRAGIDAMVREAELEDMERKWREQNEAIMKASPVLPGADLMQPPIAEPSLGQLEAQATPTSLAKDGEASASDALPGDAAASDDVRLPDSEAQWHPAGHPDGMPVPAAEAAPSPPPRPAESERAQPQLPLDTPEKNR